MKENCDGAVFTPLGKWSLEATILEVVPGGQSGTVEDVNGGRPPEYSADAAAIPGLEAGSQVMLEKVSRQGMPDTVTRTWILTSRDRMHPRREQRASIEAPGGVQNVITMDTCHALMVSEPGQLAELLVARSRAYEQA